MGMRQESWQETLRGLSTDEFQILRDAVGEESRARETQHLSALRIGDLVEFEDRRGTRHLGTVTRINARTISVDCAPTDREGTASQWRVAASFVRRVVTVESPQVSLPESLLDADFLRNQSRREKSG